MPPESARLNVLSRFWLWLYSALAGSVFAALVVVLVYFLLGGAGLVSTCAGIAAGCLMPARYSGRFRAMVRYALMAMLNFAVLAALIGTSALLFRYRADALLGALALATTTGLLFWIFNDLSPSASAVTEELGGMSLWRDDSTATPESAEPSTESERLDVADLDRPMGDGFTHDDDPYGPAQGFTVLDDMAINPANGLPMVGGIGGFDVEGNPYGFDRDTFDSMDHGSVGSTDYDSFSSGRDPFD